MPVPAVRAAFLLAGTLLLACSGDSTGPEPNAFAAFTPPDTVDYTQIGGGRLAFERRGFGARPGMIVIDADARQVSAWSGTLLADMAISPDGRHIAYRGVPVVDDPRLKKVDLLDLTTGHWQTLSPEWGAPTFRDPGHVLIARLDPCTLEVREVPITARNSSGTVIATVALPTPCWSTAVSATIGGRMITAQPRGIYLVHQGSPDFELIYEAGNVHVPTWSPAGDRIAFLEVANADGTTAVTALKVMSWPSRTVTTLAEWDGMDPFPSLAWCGHGTTIAFTRPGADLMTGHVWIVPASGGTPHRLTHLAGVVDEDVTCTH